MGGSHGCGLCVRQALRPRKQSRQPHTGPTGNGSNPGLHSSTGNESLWQPAGWLGRRFTGRLVYPAYCRKDGHLIFGCRKVPAIFAVLAYDAGALTAAAGLAGEIKLAALDFAAGHFRPGAAVLLCAASLPDSSARGRGCAIVPPTGGLAVPRRVFWWYSG